ncbi:MAG: hypothetical protein ACXWZS_03775 [Gemmatirosa sp.]
MPSAPSVPLALLAMLVGAPATAQLPGVPAAPSAFVGAGVALAANAGMEQNALANTDGSGRRSRWTYGGAAAFAPTSARWQVVGGFAAQRWGDGYRDPATAFGGRGAWSVWRNARFGATAFGGIGFARAKLDVPDGAEAADRDDVLVVRQIPIGAAVGMRGALGATRAWALSIAPQYVFYSLSFRDDAITASRPRLSVLAEAALTPRLGLAVALEDGSRASASEPGPRGTTLGVALSFALGGR